MKSNQNLYKPILIQSSVSKIPFVENDLKDMQSLHTFRVKTMFWALMRLFLLNYFSPSAISPRGQALWGYVEQLTLKMLWGCWARQCTMSSVRNQRSILHELSPRTHLTWSLSPPQMGALWLLLFSSPNLLLWSNLSYPSPCLIHPPLLPSSWCHPKPYLTFQVHSRHLPAQTNLSLLITSLTQHTIPDCFIGLSLVSSTNTKFFWCLWISTVASTGLGTQ